jgi:hypothetical protein
MSTKKGGLLKPNPKSIVIPVIDDDEPDELLTEDAVVAWLHVTKQWLADHRTRIEPIIPHIAMGRRIVYSKRAIQVLLKSLERTKPRWDRPAA